MESCIAPWATYPSHAYQKYTVINANILSCITHQLNIIKCITKQYHEMTIEYLSFIFFMGRLHLDHSALTSSSFMKSSFLIQMIRWKKKVLQELSSSYSSSHEGSSLNGGSLIFNCSHLLLLFLWVELKVITSFWHTFFAWMNPMILGCHSRWLSPLLHSSLLLLPLQFAS